VYESQYVRETSATTSWSPSVRIPRLDAVHAAGVAVVDVAKGDVADGARVAVRVAAAGGHDSTDDEEVV
jgi:hypothetical protein